MCEVRKAVLLLLFFTDEDTDTERSSETDTEKFHGNFQVGIISTHLVSHHFLIFTLIGIRVHSAGVIWWAQFSNISTRLKPVGTIPGFELIKSLRGREGSWLRETSMNRALCEAIIISDVHSNLLILRRNEKIWVWYCERMYSRCSGWTGIWTQDFVILKAVHVLLQNSVSHAYQRIIWLLFSALP